MGVDITTYRSRIGSYKHTCVQDVVTITCFGSFNSGDLKTTGSVVFIGLLLLIAGIESNPGPNEIKRIILTIAISLLACVYFQRLDHVLYTVCLLIVVNIFCAVNVEEIGTRTNADYEHMIGADVPQNATPPEHDNEGESEGGNDKVEIQSGKDIPSSASTSEHEPSISKDISENIRNGENGAAAFGTGMEETATGEECLRSEGDITELDKGSDGIAEYALKPLTEEERKSIELFWNDKDFEQALEDKSFAGAYDKKMTEWEQEDVNVAVLGRTGVGKSRFINAFRCCTSSEDSRFAQVGSDETTFEAKAYPHPRNKRLILWDLPGMGTKKFSRKTYVEDKRVSFQNYHIYLIMASDRFTEDDIYLAKEIEKIGKTFLFVRTRVDINLDDLDDVKDVKGEIKKMRDYCSKSLSDEGFASSEVYLISSKYVNHQFLDFEQLLERLVMSLEGLKKEVVLYSLQFNTNIFIDNKAAALQSRLKYVIFKSLHWGVLPIPGIPLVDWILISNELDFYRETLGVTDANLTKLAEMTKKNVNDLIAEYKLKTFDHYKVATDVTFLRKQNDPILLKIAMSKAVESTSNLFFLKTFLPEKGILCATTYHFLKSNMCMMVEDAKKMMSILLKET